MKMKVQAQHLQPGDIVGSGDKVRNVIINSTSWPTNKVCVQLDSGRGAYWGKYTEINIERPEKVEQ